MPEPCPSPERSRDYVLERLSDADREAFEDHLAGCPACARRVTEIEEAVERLERDVARTPARTSLWEQLARTILAPGPALAYLVLLVLAYPLLELARDSNERSPEVPLLARLVGEPAFRGQGPGPDRAWDFPPQEIVLEGTESTLLLELDTGLEPADLTDGRTVELEIRGDSAPIVSQAVQLQDLGDDGVLRLLLSARQLSPGTTYRVSVIADEELLFVRSFVLRSG